VPDPSNYKLHTVAETWNVARNICLSEYSHLVVLNSKEEWDVVKAIWDSNPDFIGTTNKGDIYVGLFEIAENNFVTDSGKNFHTL
jgi:hypothetical protein